MCCCSFGSLCLNDVLHAKPSAPPAPCHRVSDAEPVFLHAVAQPVSKGPTHKGFCSGSSPEKLSWAPQLFTAVFLSALWEKPSEEASAFCCTQLESWVCGGKELKVRTGIYLLKDFGFFLFKPLFAFENLFWINHSEAPEYILLKNKFMCASIYQFGVYSQVHTVI